MATKTEKPPETPVAIDDFAAWAAEAKQKAQDNARSNAKYGEVVNPDPRLHYAVLDGDAPKASLDRHIAYHEARGFRLMPGLQVVGYKAPLVYAIPLEVYQTEIRGSRVADIRRSMKQFGISMYVERAGEYT